MTQAGFGTFPPPVVCGGALIDIDGSILNDGGIIASSILAANVFNLQLAAELVVADADDRIIAVITAVTRADDITGVARALREKIIAGRSK